jgi:phage repressor protein C with HTH and peptisase S24 domain
MTTSRKIDTERGRRIRHVRSDILGLRSQQQLADLLSKEGKEVTRGAVGNWELGKEVGLESLIALSRLAGVRVEWLASNDGEMMIGPLPVNDETKSLGNHSLFDPPNAIIRDKVEGLGRKIPVYGQAVGGVDGEFLMNGTVLYEVMAPPVISHISGAYAVAVSGSSMEPRYEDGEICFVDPKRRVKKGDYVIAQIRQEEHGPLLAYVKRFIRQNSIELVLEQFNPAKELRFAGNTVVSVHYIALAGNA